MKEYLYSDKPYIIAETAYTFEGDKQYLLTQTNELSDSINGIKYHMLLNLEGYMSVKHPVYEPLKQWLLDEHEWKEILSVAKSRDLDTIILADDVGSINFCKSYHDLVDGIELHAACINDIELLNEAIAFAREYNKVFILGISGFEIQELLDIIEYVNSASVDHVLLMYGFQNYPTDIELVNISKIEALEDILGHKVGYADHTSYADGYKESLIVASYARGANFQEIHYVLEEGIERTDYVTGLCSERLEKIMEVLNQVYKGIGKKDFRLNSGEKKYLDFRKVPVYAGDMNKGDVLSLEDIKYIRVEKPRRQNKFKEIESLLGKPITRGVSLGQEIIFEDFNA
jgi:sialic acid synthase SpsE